MRVSLINVNLVAEDAIGQCLIHQLRFHRRRGDEVTIFTMTPPDGVPDDIARSVRVVEAIDLVGRQDPFFRTSDLYVYHYPGYYDLLDTLKSLDRGAVVLYYHNVTPPELWGAQSGRDDLARGRNAVARLAPYADLVVTVSPFNAEELTELHGVTPDRIRVLPLAAPLDRFYPGAANTELARQLGLLGKEVLLFVGRVAGNKRVDLLVEALAIARRKVPNLVLLVVGDHSSNPAFAEVMAGIQARIRALGLEDAVIFTGRVDDLVAYYRLADLYVTASLHEGFGVPLIEAMACGVPVIASRATAHPWVVGDAGILVAPGDVDAMADRIVGVLGNDLRHGELAQRGLRRAADFSLETYYAGWTAIVDETLAWLATHPARPLVAALPGRGDGRDGSDMDDLPLGDDLALLQKAATGILQPYTVRSGLPIIGPLIAWLRRNLTSHLREPYLDPTLRRQERFNWLVVQTLTQAAQVLAQLQAAQAENAQLRQRLLQVEAELHSRPLTPDAADDAPQAASTDGAGEQA